MIDRLDALETTPEQGRSARFLVALTRLGKHTYGGTVPAKEKARRRAKNRVAKRSRKANRP